MLILGFNLLQSHATLRSFPPPQVHYGFYQSYMIFGAFHNALDNRWIYLDFRKFDGLEI